VPSELVFPFPFVLGAKTKAAPHGFIPALHQGPEVFWADRAVTGERGAWVPRKLEHLQQIYLDNVNFTSRGMASYAALIGETWEILPIEADERLHPLMRTMLNPAFSPRRMAEFEARIRRYAREYIGSFKAKGGCDFVGDFAFTFPIKVFLELMGLPQDEVGQFLAWEHGFLHEPDVEKIKSTTREVAAYLRREIDDRRARPRDDLISFGLQCSHDGQSLSEQELLGFCMNLFLGGLDTVSTAMAWQFWHLARHQGDQETLRANPAMIPAAIDEFMRAYASVATYRVCVNETRIGGATIKPGDMVVMATFLAGHDPGAYPDPETVVLDRAPRHVNFGYGAHLCIGMHLARREMRIALEEFLAEIPPFRIAEDADITYYLAGIIQPITLPLVWDV